MAASRGEREAGRGGGSAVAPSLKRKKLGRSLDGARQEDKKKDPPVRNLAIRLAMNIAVEKR